MKHFFVFIQSNYEWLFGGIGVVIITGLIDIFNKKKNGITQKQVSKKNSNNTQIGKIDIN